jgi:acetylornithine deacetylase/succinyl-diaminopimelate desuccinylase-like protein
MSKKNTSVCIIGFVFTVLAALGSSQTAAERRLNSDRIPADRMKQYADLAVQWQREYLRIDTTNPPGNEARAADFFKRILDQEGIENQMFKYAPGRADLWARIPHRTRSSQRPIILLNHMDVVTSDAWPRRPGHEKRRPGSVHGHGHAEAREGGT